MALGSRGAGGARTPSIVRTLARAKRGSWAEIDEALARGLQPADRMRCLHPDCANLCEWPTESSAGRPQTFCSRNCRQNFERTRTRLCDEIAVLTELRDRGGAPVETRRAIEVGLAQRSWMLRRYPDPTREQRSGLAADRAETTGGRKTVKQRG